MEHHNSISLGGSDWRLGYKKIYDGSASATIAEVEKMTEWFNATVPGNVRADLMAAKRLPDLFVGKNNEAGGWVNDCVWWYEKKFKHPGNKFSRYFLELRGIDYISQVYFNGRKLGENEGMFTRHLYDVTSMMRDENVLNVRILGSSFLPKPRRNSWRRMAEKIGAPLQDGQEVFPERTATVKCQMGFGWDFAPDMRTMGVWDEVNLIGCGSALIGYVSAQPSVFRELDSAKLSVRLHLNSAAAVQVNIVVQLRPANFEGKTQKFSFNAFVKKGIEALERNVIIEEPRLWNPWDRGEPNLYELTIGIFEGDKLSDRVSCLIGLRDVKLARNPGASGKSADWTFTINGNPEFIRGANWVPADSLPGRLREEDYRELIRLAKEAHINMFRVWGGGLREKRYFYEMCSREGILVWQEFPFSCVFLGRLPSDEAFLRLAEKEVTSIVKSIANYPCVAVYCGGNEFSPSRNSKLLTRVAQAVRSADGSRPFLPASPARGDSHNWFVWHGFANINEYRNDFSQFASEFGLQAAPAAESLKRFLSKREVWPPGEEWEYHKAQLNKLERYVGPASEFSLEHFVEATQKMQAFALQTAIEHYRRRKPNCSGAMFWQFNEPWPAVSWSVIDYYRVPKLAYWKLKDIYNPVLISIVYELRRYEPGEEIPIEVWIVNDMMNPLEGCILDIYLKDGGQPLMNLSFDVGTVPPDSSRSYFQFSIKLPRRETWLLCADMRLGDKVISHNSYDLNVWDAGEATWWNRTYDRAGKLVLK